jgi:hypothetical protein
MTDEDSELIARLLSGWELAEPMREYVTEQGCVVRTHAVLNCDGERVEHVTMEGGE